ncbi:kinase-like domain-containing protein [Rhizophagus irregularis DAOM 181602=DAOM 197198]|uniref:Tpk1p n=1 Tax=Rhizophagus irregularis (strain DAOM 197198w) TaxID=1432141 RepID=A0A015JVG1_RHIIW|nr:Tpk1p [Rhizophagus irregularis DAOM 197198w]GBC32140.2 kinase-like domain-containing protein [Rhizophagus irregularis DAOM 181602=DAOM 197198]
MQYIFNEIFKNWTSGNDNIDKFIQDTQLSVFDNYKEDLAKYIEQVGLMDIGYIDKWDNDNQNWKRNNTNMIVALKSLDNSEHVTLEFMNEFYYNSKTKDYMMILDYAEEGNLRDYLDKNYNILNWDKKIGYLQDAILGLKCIHEKELFHRDLHIGNILKLKHNTVITDMGLCKPANYGASETLIYGNLPYIAPEILRGQKYTKAADIYSFGIIMYEVISGLRPYYNIRHENLAIGICQGLRPRFNIKVPQLIVHLIKRCLDSDPLNRPKAEEIENILYTWNCKSSDEQTIILQAQIKEADNINNNSSNITTPSSLQLVWDYHMKVDFLILIIFPNQKILMIITSRMII